MRRLEITGVVVGLLASAVPVIQWVSGLGESPPAEIDPRITAVTSQSVRQPLGDYLRETNQPREPFTREQLRQPGYVFDVTVRIVGLRGKELPLRWSMYRRPETRLRGPTYNRDAGAFEPKSPKHATSWPVWVPYPPSSGSYYVRFTLLGDNQRPVSNLNSPIFRYPAI